MRSLSACGTWSSPHVRTAATHGMVKEEVILLVQIFIHEDAVRLGNLLLVAENSSQRWESEKVRGFSCQSSLLSDFIVHAFVLTYEYSRP